MNRGVEGSGWFADENRGLLRQNGSKCRDERAVENISEEELHGNRSHESQMDAAIGFL